MTLSMEAAARDVLPAAPSPSSVRDVSFDYLRACLTLMVVAHHSSLAYTNFAHADPIHYLASTAPVVDRTRWLLLDYAENFNDVFFMSLMFFISGLFVWPALRRYGAARFLGHRILRLGLPFAVGVTILMPLAYYASWRASGHETGYLDYWRQNIMTDGWPSGPLWFIWVLLLFDVIAAGLYLALPRAAGTSRMKDVLGKQPVLFAGAMMGLCGLAYLPMLARFGFGAWAPLFTAPFYFQICRIGLYLVWFLAGCWIGSTDLDRGMLARDGLLARHWRWWIRFCLVAYNLLVFVPRSPALARVLSVSNVGALESVLWVISCVASCVGFLALFCGAVRVRRAWMDSLARSAYGIYLVHYVFVLWVQYLFLDLPVHAGIKFLATFVLALLFSWVAAQLLLRIPIVRTIV